MTTKFLAALQAVPTLQAACKGLGITLTFYRKGINLCQARRRSPAGDEDLLRKPASEVILKLRSKDDDDPIGGGAPSADEGPAFVKLCMAGLDGDD